MATFALAARRAWDSGQVARDVSARWPIPGARFSIVELHADVRLGDAEGHDQKRIGSNGMPWFVGLGLGHARSARFVAALRIKYYV